MSTARIVLFAGIACSLGSVQVAQATPDMHRGTSTGRHAMAPVLTSAAEGTTTAARTGDAAFALVENHGQWRGPMQMVARIGPTRVRLEPNSIALQQHFSAEQGVLVRLEFDRASPDARLEGIERSPGLRHYYFGNDPAGWHTRVPAWKSAAYRDAWDGIDLVVHGEGAAAKYDVLVEPGSSLDRVAFRVQGATGLSIDAASGTLLIETELGVLAQPAPTSHEIDASGARKPLAVRYRMLGDMRYGFESPPRTPDAALEIDPGLIWSTYLGSSSVSSVGDKATAVCLGASGEAVVAGYADWSDFPVTPGAFSTNFLGGYHGFVTVFDASGATLIYSSLFGGTEPGDTIPLEVAMAEGSQVVAAGVAKAAGFPTTPNAYDKVKNSIYDSGFVMKFTADGGDLVFATLLEGSQSEVIDALAVAPDGGIVVGGQSVSTNFPVTPAAFDKTHGPGQPGFVSKFDPTGTQLQWSTFFASTAWVRALCVTEDGTVLLTGQAGTGLPLSPGAFDTVPGSFSEGFVAALSTDGSQLLWASYLGGSLMDEATAIACHPAAGIVVAGQTGSSDFATTPGAFQAASSTASYQMFMTRIDPTGSSLIASTCLGGSGGDIAYAATIDAAGIATIAGMGGWTDFPHASGAYDNVASGPEGVLARFSPDGSRLFYSTFLGGGGTEHLTALACDAYGTATAVGWSSGGYPVTPGSFSPTPAGGQTDAVVTRMDLLPVGAQSYGTSTPACHGPIAIGVTQMPAAGATSFGVYASGAPPGATGVLGLGVSALPAGIPLGEALLWVSPGLAPNLSTVVVQPTPYVEKSIAIPSGTSGLRAFAQFMFLNPVGCGVPGTLSASNALALTVQ